MMKISDAIDILHDLADELNGLAEAIYLAARILSALDANEDKASNIIKAMRICNDLESVEDCQKCPYHGDCQNHGSQLDKDIVALLTLAYLQGGDSDEQA